MIGFFNFKLDLKLFSGRCHTNVIMDKFVQEPSCHSHAANPNRLHVIRIQNEIKERSVLCEEGTSILLQNALRKAPLSIAADLPLMDALAQTVRRQRPQLLLDINGQLPQILKKTDRGENFVLFEDDSMIIFTKGESADLEPPAPQHLLGTSAPVRHLSTFLVLKLS